MKNIFNVENRFFYMMSSMVDLLALNIIFLLTCIPIVTIVTNIIALNSTMVRRVENDGTHPVKLYFYYWKKEFKNSIRLTLLIVPAITVVVTSAAFSIALPNLSLFQKVASIVIFIIVFIGSDTLLMYHSRYESTIKNGLKNTVVMLFGSFRLIIFGVIQTILFLYLISPFGILLGIYIFIFGGIAFWSNIKCRLYLKVFKKYELRQVTGK